MNMTNNELTKAKIINFSLGTVGVLMCGFSIFIWWVSGGPEPFYLNWLLRAGALIVAFLGVSLIYVAFLLSREGFRYLNKRVVTSAQRNNELNE